MRMTRRQLQTLNRYSRATHVWKRLGVRLSPRTRVVVSGNKVRLIRQGKQ